MVGVEFFIGLEVVLVVVVGLVGMLVLVFFSMVNIWFLEVGYGDSIIEEVRGYINDIFILCLFIDLLLNKLLCF